MGERESGEIVHFFLQHPRVTAVAQTGISSSPFQFPFCMSLKSTCLVCSNVG